jgi:phosphate transporter
VDGLKNYVILNYIGIKKILHKYEKYTGRSCFNKYMKRVEHMPFCESTTLSFLMTGIERLYAENFTDGNIEKAKRHLNPSWVRHLTVLPLDNILLQHITFYLVFLRRHFFFYFSV